MDEDAEHWFLEYSTAADALNWSSQCKLSQFQGHMIGAAAIWVRILKETNKFPVSLTALKNAFLDAFPPTNAVDAVDKLYQRVQFPNEDVNSNALTIHELCIKAYGPRITEWDIMKHIKRGLRQEFQTALAGVPDSSMAQFLNQCRRLQAQFGGSGHHVVAAAVNVADDVRVPVALLY